MSAHIVTATDADFASIINPENGGLVLVDFWAPWCGPCKALAPLIDELAEEFAGEAVVAKLDVSANEATSDAVGVQNIPLLVLYRGGEEVARHTGGLSKSRLAAMIEQYL